jgi:hypothetical protein
VVVDHLADDLLAGVQHTELFLRDAFLHQVVQTLDQNVGIRLRVALNFIKECLVLFFCPEALIHGMLREWRVNKRKQFSLFF